MFVKTRSHASVAIHNVYYCYRVCWYRVDNSCCCYLFFKQSDWWWRQPKTPAGTPTLNYFSQLDLGLRINAMSTVDNLTP